MGKKKRDGGKAEKKEKKENVKLLRIRFISGINGSKRVLWVKIP